MGFADTVGEGELAGEMDGLNDEEGRLVDEGAIEGLKLDEGDAEGFSIGT